MKSIFSMLRRKNRMPKRKPKSFFVSDKEIERCARKARAKQHWKDKDGFRNDWD